MVKKSGKKDHDDDDDRKDLTRIEDLSEFLHEEDPELDNQFGGFNRPEPSSTGINLDALDDDFNDSTPEFGSSDGIADGDQLPPDLPPDIPADESENDFQFQSEDSFAETASEEIADEISFSLEESLPSFSEDETPAEQAEIFEETSESNFEETYEEDSKGLKEPVDAISAPRLTPERFEDVKTFAQHFTYGQSTGGGNPPFSIIVRHIKFKEEADDILALLREFGIVTTTNESETLKALEFGTLLIPQISEYVAIVLAHKMRRFDLDLEVGLSDEIHPSKSGETNPRGLVKKESLKQNKSESMKLADHDQSIKDVLISTSSSLEGFKVARHLGVQTTVAIIEEDELEKLAFVSRQEREHSEQFEGEGDQDAFKKFKQNYEALYEDLKNQLVQKAYAQNANALLGLNFQLNPLPFDRRDTRVNAYQVTCSATLALVTREDV